MKRLFAFMIVALISTPALAGSWVNNDEITEPFIGTDEADTLTNNGSLMAGVKLKGGNDHLINNGLIEGVVGFAAGDDVLTISSPDAVIIGRVNGGRGHDKIVIEMQRTWKSGTYDFITGPIRGVEEIIIPDLPYITVDYSNGLSVTHRCVCTTPACRPCP